MGHHKGFVDGGPRDLETGQPTKRIILRAIASQFDPLGMMAPVSIRARLITIEIWLSKADWDVELPDAVADKWNEIKNEIQKLGKFQKSNSWKGVNAWPCTPS